MKRSLPELENDYTSIREQIRRAQIDRVVVMSEIIANAIVSFSAGVKRFFANAATANNPALPALPAR